MHGVPRGAACAVRKFAVGSMLREGGETVPRKASRFSRESEQRRRSSCDFSTTRGLTRGLIAAIDLALKHKGNLAELVNVREAMALRQGPSIGAVWTLRDIAKRIGVAAALGPTTCYGAIRCGRKKSPPAATQDADKRKLPSRRKTR